MATAVGYQPVGMKPFTWLFRGFSASMTAMQLLSALATKSVSPSGAMHSASGVLPSGDCGNSAVEIVSCTVPAPVSTTYTALLDAQATNNRLSFGCTTI